jgi:predicted nucleic acid-binding protein
MTMMLDTNILVYLSAPNLGYFDVALAAMEREFERGAQFVICPFILREFARVMTGKLKCSTTTTDALIRAFLAGYDVVDEKESFPAWQKLFVEYNLTGNSVYDAGIAAIMATHNISHILTNNPKDFERYTHLTTVPMLK